MDPEKRLGELPVLRKNRIDDLGDGLLLCGPCREELAPEFWSGCGRCGAGTPPDLAPRASCGWCKSMRLAMDRTVVLGPYQETLREAVLSVKRVAGEPLAVALARLFWHHRQESLRQVEVNVVVPVPMHWRRRFARGINNPDVLAAGFQNGQIRVWRGDRPGEDIFRYDMEQVSNMVFATPA